MVFSQNIYNYLTFNNYGTYVSLLQGKVTQISTGEKIKLYLENNWLETKNHVTLWSEEYLFQVLLSTSMLGDKIY